jgi:cysteinyl-tRNA synthetase
MAFREDAAKLSITSPDTYAPATEHIPQIIRQIERLIEKKCAYQIEQDGWYFDLSAFPDYGKLAGRTVEQAEDGVSRIDSSDSKRNRGDFCIWKFSKAGEPSWGAPFGAGRPGWHIEDTAITEDYFGPQYEIHGGGRDLIFPHHEAEIAQQESASGKKPFVQYWMHAGLVTVEGKKMSKSLGNFVTVRDFLTRHSPNLFRFFVAQHHYRAPLDYSEAAVAAASSALASITEFWLKARFAAEKSQKSTDAIDLREFDREFNEAMNDDCNTPLALASLFKLANASGKRLWYISGTNASEIGAWLEAKLAIFGVILTAPALPESIAKLMGEREAFRSHQQFIQADRLRKEIEDLGYRVDDTPAGSLFLGPR